jgi:uncharacterized delta-60 repeat protein
MKKVFIFLPFLCISQFVFGQDGTLDNSFGINGRVITRWNTSDNVANDILVQNDGKIVVGGSCALYLLDSNTYSLYSQLIRHNTNGTIDTTFGIKGKVISTFSNTENWLTCMALQSDGKILAAGSSLGSRRFAIARYNTNGTRDTSFAKEGIVSTSLGVYYASINCIALQSDGKMVAGGGGGLYSDRDFTALARYNTDGSLDVSFNGTGIIIKDLDTIRPDYVQSIALQSDNKVVVSARIFVGSRPTRIDLVLMRYNTNGILDSTFGINGLVKITNFEGMKVQVLTNGKILVGGSSINSTTSRDFSLLRFNSNGVLDANFGISGKIITRKSDLYASVQDMLVLKDDKIVLFGSWSNALNFAMARYNSEGILDNTFGTNGIALVSTILKSEGYAKIALQNDGKLIACGGFADTIRYSFLVTRFNNTVNVGVKTIEKNNPLSIYPNPTKNELNIDVKDLIDCDLLIKISDLTGRIVYQNKYDKTLINKVLKININDLITGLYVLTIHSEKEIKSQLILKN